MRRVRKSTMRKFLAERAARAAASGAADRPDPEAGWATRNPDRAHALPVRHPARLRDARRADGALTSVIPAKLESHRSKEQGDSSSAGMTGSRRMPEPTSVWKLPDRLPSPSELAEAWSRVIAGALDLAGAAATRAADPARPCPSIRPRRRAPSASSPPISGPTRRAAQGPAEGRVRLDEAVDRRRRARRRQRAPSR